MNRTIRLTESELRGLINEAVKQAVNEGSYFSHSYNEWGKDYFKDAQFLARGIINYLNALEEEGNSSDALSTSMLLKNLEKNVSELANIVPLFRKIYIGKGVNK